MRTKFNMRDAPGVSNKPPNMDWRLMVSNAPTHQQTARFDSRVAVNRCTHFRCQLGMTRQTDMAGTRPETLMHSAVQGCGPTTMPRTLPLGLTCATMRPKPIALAAPRGSGQWRQVATLAQTGLTPPHRPAGTVVSGAGPDREVL